MAEILVIDDEAQMRRLIARILNGAGHTVHQAGNGRDGIALFHQVHPVKHPDPLLAVMCQVHPMACALDRKSVV